MHLLIHMLAISIFFFKSSPHNQPYQSQNTFKARIKEKGKIANTSPEV